MLTVQKSTAKIGEKFLRFQVAAIALVFSNLSSVWGQAQPVARGDSLERVCEPIAKVLSGDLRLAALSKLCKEDQINPVNGGKVEVFCYPSGNILYLSRGIVGEQCSPSQRQVRGCTLENGRTCIKPKGPNEDDNAPILITPYGVVIINPRPTLSWSATASATSYTVQVEGKGTNWSVQVQKTRLPYPKEQPAMQPGNVYNVNILANRGDELIPSSSVLLVVSADKAQQVATTINRLQSLNIPQDDLAIDMDAVYEAQNLVNESIEVLKARTKAGTQNPTIYRLLGDRYLGADLPDAAKQAYLSATKLAQKANNVDELAKAEVGAKIAEQGQKRGNGAEGS